MIYWKRALYKLINKGLECFLFHCGIVSNSKYSQQKKITRITLWPTTPGTKLSGWSITIPP